MHGKTKPTDGVMESWNSKAAGRIQVIGRTPAAFINTPLPRSVAARRNLKNRFHGFSIVSVAGLILAGCAVGPNYQRPTVNWPSAETYGKGGDAKADIPHGSW